MRKQEGKLDLPRRSITVTSRIFVAPFLLDANKMADNRQREILKKGHAHNIPRTRDQTVRAWLALPQGFAEGQRRQSLRHTTTSQFNVLKKVPMAAQEKTAYMGCLAHRYELVVDQFVRLQFLWHG